LTLLISYLPLLHPDHLAVRVKDAGKLQRLFSEVLGLPVSWYTEWL
jgi:extradiol dioxygenase family protein